MTRRLSLLAGLALLAATPALPAAAAPERVTVRVVDPQASYPEGPLRVDGRLFYTEYGAQTVMRWDGRRLHRVWQRTGCGPSGLAPTRRGGLLVTCYDSNTLVEISRRGRTRRVIGTDRRGRRFLGPNDLTRDARGGIYVTASGVYSADAPVQGTILYRAPGGGLRRVARGIHYANGIALSPDGRHLYVSEMLGYRVLRYRVGPGGRLSGRTVLVSLADLSPDPDRAPLDGPDGLKTDARGHLYITHNGAGRVLEVTARGRLVRTYSVDAQHVTNVALGATARTLFVTSAIDPDHPPYPGKVYALRRTGGSPPARAAGLAAAGRCRRIAFTPNSDDVATNIRVTRGTCRVARRVVREIQRDAAGLRHTTGNGFACRGRRFTDEMPYVRWRCVRDDTVVRWRKY